MLGASHFQVLSRHMENGFVTARLNFVETPLVKSAHGFAIGSPDGKPDTSTIWPLQCRARNQN